MKYCKKCLYPDTKPQLVFNNDGICSACTNNKMKDEIDWDKKKKEFIQIIEKYRSKNHNNYDCIIPVSGGKDSTYQTYVMKEEFGLNPLAVNFHPLDQTEIGKKNLVFYYAAIMILESPYIFCSFCFCSSLYFFS